MERKAVRKHLFFYSPWNWPKTRSDFDLNSLPDHVRGVAEAREALRQQRVVDRETSGCMAA